MSDSLYQQARQAWEAGQLHPCRQFLEQLLVLQPEAVLAHLLLGQVAQAQRSWKEARQCFETVLKLEPGHPQGVQALAQWYVQRQQPQEAERIYAEFLAQTPGQLELRVEYAALLGERGDHPAAERELHLCLQQDPDRLDAWLLLGSLLQECGDWFQARYAFQQIIARQPRLAEAWRRLGLLELQAGEMEQARACLQQSLSLDPGDAETWNNLGALALMQATTPAETAEAIRTCMQGLARDSRNARILLNIGLGFFQLQNYPMTLFYLDQARVLDAQLQQGDLELGLSLFRLGKPGFAQEYLERSLSSCQESAENQAEAHTCLAILLAHRGDCAAARQHYLAAEALQPGQGRAWLAAALLPPLLESAEAEAGLLEAWRRSLDTAISQAGPPLQRPPVEMPGIFRAYASGPLRADQERLARLWQTFLPPTPTLSLRPAGGPPWRIGLVSRYFHSHSVMHVFARLIAALAHTPEFEVQLFDLGPGGEDETRRRLKALPLQYYSCSGLGLEPLRQRVAAAQLDVLLYPELGMDPLGFALAQSRLARFQGVLPGHPVTTGLSSLDWFFSSTWLEPATAAASYTERLIRLDELLPDYPRPVFPARLKSRAELGLRPVPTYLCPMMLFKFHPVFDAVLAEILNADPEGEIICFSYPPQSLHAGLESHLLTRWATRLPEVHRIRFLPWAAREDFLQILRQAEVVLDTFPFGGGNTSYLTLAAGTPLITLDGQDLRGSSSAALYRRMGWPEALARDPQDYARRAVELARNPDLRQEFSEKIEQNSGVLFDNPAGSKALIAFLKNSLQNAGHT